jgi:hypothetical protein
MKKIIVLTVVAIASQAVAIFAGEPEPKQVIAPPPPPLGLEGAASLTASCAANLNCEARSLDDSVWDGATSLTAGTPPEGIGKVRNFTVIAVTPVADWQFSRVNCQGKFGSARERVPVARALRPPPQSALSGLGSWLPQGLQRSDSPNHASAASTGKSGTPCERCRTSTIVSPLLAAGRQDESVDAARRALCRDERF